MNVILASASERRRELLKRIINDFQIIVSDFDETKVKFNGNCGSYVMDLAKGKALSVASKLNKDESIIIGSDTIVFLEDKVLTKELITDYVCTEVKFSTIPDEVITSYIETGEPMDKAGAYGIQGYGGIFVEKIHGCYYNIIGLPLNRLYFLLRDMGVNL